MECRSRCFIMHPLGKFTEGGGRTTDCQDNVTIKNETKVNIPEEYFAGRVLFKNMAVDTMPKLTPKDWVKEQMEDMDIHKIVKLLKSK